MLPKSADYQHSFAEPEIEVGFPASVDDFDDSYAVYLLTIVIGLYLLITVPLWRGSLFLTRRLRRSRSGISRSQEKLWLESAGLD
ncbi:hypothetical protein EAH87_04540 [Sphingomonas koreensis]|nr:hypothetical protein EAH87_04540 [Sphingomonas koreensis]